MYVCPVCSYNRLRYPPEEGGVICPSCGTQFGYTDAGVSHDQLFAEWLEGGALWQSKVVPPPPGWNAFQQLANRGRVAESRPITRTEYSPTGFTQLGERLAIVQNRPRTEIRGHWQIIDLAEGTRVAPA